MKFWIPLLLATTLIPATQVVQAEVLLLDAIAEEPVNSPEGLQRPTRGLTMESSPQCQFGVNPTMSTPGSGSPPITRWDYPDYSVFLEFEMVLISSRSPLISHPFYPMRRLPAEWEPQSATLLTWPHTASDWSDILQEADAAYTEIVATILRFQPVILGLF